MKRYPFKAQVYIKFVIGTAFVVLTYLTITTDFSFEVLKGLLFFGSLAVLTDSLPVRLPKGGYVAVTMSVIYASLILFGPFTASCVAISGMVFRWFIHSEHDPVHKLLFNCAQYTLAASFAGKVYTVLGGVYHDIDFLSLTPLVAAALACFIINVTAITLILAFVQNLPPWGMWLTNFKWSLPNMLTLPILGVLMAYVYVSIGPLGVTLFFVPLLLARFIFKSYMDTREIFMNTLEALASSLDAKDKYTKGHSDRVANYAVELARHLKMPEDEVETIQHMAFLHDVGKIGVNDELLARVGRLTVDEFARIKMHPVIGANILKDINYLGIAMESVRHHHEKYDGTGYPDRLQGENIPFGARIITLADSFDAMTSDRSYRTKMITREALDEVRRCAGTHFDPKLAEAFLDCWQQKELQKECNGILEVASTLDE